MCKRTLLLAVIGAVYIGPMGSTATAGEIYAFGVGFGLDGGYKTNTWDFILKERMGPNSEIEGTISLYYKDVEYEVALVAILMDFVYQWRWNIAGGFNWYVGPLTSIGLCLAEYVVTETDPYFGPEETVEFFYDACLGIGAQTGIEYNFNDNGVPLILSANIRPELNIVKPSIVNVVSLSFHFGLTYIYK